MTEQDSIIKWLQTNGFDVNRQNYLDLYFDGDIPDGTDLTEILPEHLWSDEDRAAAGVTEAPTPGPE